MFLFFCDDLDTETTGLEIEKGHRIIGMRVGRSSKTLHVFINPEREIDKVATSIHGIDYERIKGCSIFSDIYLQFLEFIKYSPLVIHKARFEVSFLNSELRRVYEKLQLQNKILDTLQIARKKFSGS